MRLLSRGIGVLACSMLGTLLLYSAWQHIGNGAYIRTVFCLVIAALCMLVVYSEIKFGGEATE